MSGIRTIEKKVNRLPDDLEPQPGSIMYSMQKLKEALDEHDRLTQPRCFDDPRWQETDIRNGMAEE